MKFLQKLLDLLEGRGDHFGFCPHCGCDLFDNPAYEHHAKGCPGYHVESYDETRAV